MEGRVSEEVKSVEGRADASQVEIGGGSQCHRRKRKRVKKLHNRKRKSKRMQSGIYASQGQIDDGGRSHKHPNPGLTGSSKAVLQNNLRLIKRKAVEHAKIALAYYEEKQGAAFEIVEVFYSNLKGLINPKYQHYEVWCHVSFTAKPKNADCIDVSPKHLFGELLEIDYSSEFKATNCSAFEPSYNDYPGFHHGCIICPHEKKYKKYHPGVGYTAGRPPWYVPQRSWF